MNFLHTTFSHKFYTLPWSHSHLYISQTQQTIHTYRHTPKHTPMVTLSHLHFSQTTVNAYIQAHSQTHSHGHTLSPTFLPDNRQIHTYRHTPINILPWSHSHLHTHSHMYRHTVLNITITLHITTALV